MDSDANALDLSSQGLQEILALQVTRYNTRLAPSLGIKENSTSSGMSGLIPHPFHFHLSSPFFLLNFYLGVTWNTAKYLSVSQRRFPEPRHPPVTVGVLYHTHSRTHTGLLDLNLSGIWILTSSPPPGYSHKHYAFQIPGKVAKKKDFSVALT